MCWDAVPSCAAPSCALRGHLGFEEEETRRLRHVFFVRTDNQNGWDEMASRHCLADDVQRTPHKKSMFVRLGSVNPRAADALHDDGWMDGFRRGHGRATISPPRNTAAAAQFDEGMQCIPQVGRTTCVGGMCGDGLRNQQADVARGPEVPSGGCNGQDDGWDNDDDVGTVGTLTTTEAGEISEDYDDEDCVPCCEDEADIAREDATHEAHTCSSILLRRTVRSMVMASQRWELSMMPRMTMPLTSIS